MYLTHNSLKHPFQQRPSPVLLSHTPVLCVLTPSAQATRVTSATNSCQPRVPILQVHVR